MRVWPLALMLLLGACAATPQPAPLPDPLPAPVLCALPAGMSETKEPPAKPGGDYAQREVAAYVTALHEWGAAGWTRVTRARQWSQNCVDRAAVRDGGGAD